MLYCWLFFSGFAGLVYELVWMRYFRPVMGSTTASVAGILAIYMAGLAIGSYVAGRWIDARNRPILIYGLLQALLGVFALLVPWLISGAQPVLGWIHSNAAAGPTQLAFRLIVCTFILIVPASLIGATFPVVASYFSALDSRLGARIGRLYAVNSIGAVAGTLATGFILIPSLGLSGTNYAAMAINLIVSASVVIAAKSSKSLLAGDGNQRQMSPDDTKHRTRRTPRTTTTEAYLCLSAVFVSGLTAMIFEVAWTRVLSLIIGSSVYAFTMILAAFITGLAMGSFLSARLVNRWRLVLPILALTQTLIGLTSLIVTLILGRLPIIATSLFPSLYGSVGTVIAVEFAIVLVVLFLPTVLLGGMFPMALHIYANRIGKPGQSSGTVSAVNTTGAVIGSLVALFVLIPLAGTFVTTIAASVINVFVGAACLAILVIYGNRKRGLVFAALPVALTALGVTFMPVWDSAVLSSGPFLYAGQHKASARESDLSIEEAMQTAGRILYFKDGLSATVSVHLYDDGNLSLKVNGKTDASSQGDMRTQLFLAQLPILLHPEPDVALVIGLGSGITLGSLERYPFSKIDCVEISQEIVHAAGLFEESNKNALEDPRLNLILADGRHWVTFTKQKYDIITSEPSNPWIAGIGDLFTEEFFRHARRRLNENGIMIQWVHAYSMSGSDFKTVVKTFASVFPHTTVWEASLGKDYILVGSAEAPYSDVRRIADRINRGDLRDDLRTLGIYDIPSLFSRLVIDDDSVGSFAGDVEINTDNNVRLEFSAPLNLYQNDLQFLMSLSKYQTSVNSR